jgi:hypothetical protein
MLRRTTLGTWIVSGCVAALLAPRAAEAAGADPATATGKQKADAQKKFDHGRELSAASRYPEALAEFQGSFEIVASPNTHFSIARTLAYMGQPAEAYVEYGKTITEAQAAAAKDKRYTQTAEASDAEQRELRSKLAFLVLSVEHGDNAMVKVGDRAIDNAALRDLVPVNPGTVTVVVSVGGAEVARQTVTLGTSDRKTIVLDAQPKPPEPTAAPEQPREQPMVVVDTSPGGLRTAAYIAGGVGVAGLATFAIFGSLEKSSFNQLNDACHGEPCPPGHADDIATGRSRQTIANVGLAAGAVGLATGVVLFIVSAPSKAPATTARTSVVVGPGFVGVGGTL